MINLTLAKYRKYLGVVEQLEMELSRKPFAEEVLVEMWDGDYVKMPEVREVMAFMEDENSVVNEGEDFQLIIRRGLGNNELRKLRIKKNLTQKELADILNMNMATISQIESCQSCSTQQVRKKLSKFFRVDEDKLFPEWLSWIVKERKNIENEKVVEVGKLSLDSPDVKMLECEESKDIERLAHGAILRNKLKEIDKILTPRELKVIEIRHGLNNGTPHTLEETAQEFGVTRERIRQMEAKALEKIRGSSLFDKLKVQ